MKSKILIVALVAFSVFATTAVRAQKIAVKTNLLYGAYAYTPNLGMEISLGKKSTLDFGAGYNWFNLKGTNENNRKLVHTIGQIEYRYWTCHTFSGHFFGAHAVGTNYNISGHELPMLFGKGSKDYRYEGWGIGAGVSYGYSFLLGKHWNLEATLGLGYVRLHYDQYNCYKCAKKIGTKSKNYFGPTKAGISLIYIIK